MHMMVQHREHLLSNHDSLKILSWAYLYFNVTTCGKNNDSSLVWLRLIIMTAKPLVSYMYNESLNNNPCRACGSLCPLVFQWTSKLLEELQHGLTVVKSSKLMDDLLFGKGCKNSEGCHRLRPGRHVCYVPTHVWHGFCVSQTENLAVSK